MIALVEYYRKESYIREAVLPLKTISINLNLYVVKKWPRNYFALYTGQGC